MISILITIMPMFLGSIIGCAIVWFICDYCLQMNRFPNGRFWTFICNCIEKARLQNMESEFKRKEKKRKIS